MSAIVDDRTLAGKLPPPILLYCVNFPSFRLFGSASSTARAVFSGESGIGSKNSRPGRRSAHDTVQGRHAPPAPEKLCGCSEKEEAETVVLTMRALTPWEKQVRLQAEFPGMTSHELRNPPTSIRRAQINRRRYHLRP